MNYPEYPFEDLWIMKPDAQKRIQVMLASKTISIQQAEHLLSLKLKGYTIIPNAIPGELIGSILADLEEAWRLHPDKFIMRNNSINYSTLQESRRRDLSVRIIDFHANSRNACFAALHPSIASLLEVIFEEKPNATQSLLFERGSQQGIHQDPTYVVFDKPLFLAASWIALEDVHEGTGELLGWEGSHLIPHFLFSGAYKSWSPGRDGMEQHKAYLSHVRTECEKLNCRRFHFLPKKGDVFIWINNFAHGGAPIVDEKKTRKSLVTHYTAKSILPNFAHFTNLYKPIPMGNGGYISARHYDLKQPADGLRDPVVL